MKIVFRAATKDYFYYDDDYDSADYYIDSSVNRFKRELYTTYSGIISNWKLQISNRRPAFQTGGHRV